MKYIADRGMTATKVTAILMALGIVASGIYGMVEAGPHLVNQTVGTIGTVTVSRHSLSLSNQACFDAIWLLHPLLHAVCCSTEAARLRLMYD